MEHPPTVTRSRPAGHSLGRNLVANLLGAIGVRLPSVAMIVVLARLGTVSDVGLYALALSFATLFNLLLSDTSVSMLAVKNVSQQPEAAGHYLSLMPVANAVVGACMLLASLAVGAWLYGSSPLLFELIAILGVSIFLQSLTGGHRWYFKAVRRFDYDSALSWVTGIAMVLLAVPLFLLTHDVRWYCAGIALGSLAGYGYALAGVARLSGRSPFRWQWRLRPVGQLLREALPYAAATVAVTITWNVDTVLLGHWRSLPEVGIYGATLRVILMLRSGAAMLLPVLFPFLAHQHQADPEGFQRTFASALVVLGWLGGGMVACLTLASGGLLGTIYGSRYLAGSSILALASWSVLFSFFASVMGVALIAQNRVHLNLAAAVLGLGIELTGCWLLIPRLGGVGCAAAAVITELLVSCYLVTALRPLLKASLRRWGFPLLKVAAAVAGTLVVGAWLPVMAQVGKLVLAFAVFLGLSALLRILSASDLREIRAALQGGGPRVTAVRS